MNFISLGLGSGPALGKELSLGWIGGMLFPVFICLIFEIFAAKWNKNRSGHLYIYIVYPQDFFGKQNKSPEIGRRIVEIAAQDDQMLRQGGQGRVRSSSYRFFLQDGHFHGTYI